VHAVLLAVAFSFLCTRSVLHGTGLMGAACAAGMRKHEDPRTQPLRDDFGADGLAVSLWLIGILMLNAIVLSLLCPAATMVRLSCLSWA